MKPVENVSIGGYVFSFEDDACAAARTYLSELDSFYSKEQSGSEVMEGGVPLGSYSEGSSVVSSGMMAKGSEGS